MSCRAAGGRTGRSLTTPDANADQAVEKAKRVRRPFKRRHSARKAHGDDVYSLADVERLYSVDPQTVLNWIREGLQTVQGATRLLVRGDALNEFHAERNAKAKRPLGLTQFYCLRCHVPSEPALGSVLGATNAEPSLRFEASCRVCGTRMYRSWSKEAAQALSVCSDLLSDKRVLEFHEKSDVHSDHKVEGPSESDVFTLAGMGRDKAQPQKARQRSSKCTNRRKIETNCDSVIQPESQHQPERSQTSDGPSNTNGSCQLPLPFGFGPNWRTDE
jgi:hypothetical protein